ncbi:PPE family, PPE8 domain protein [Mycobacterium kansasii 732]|nr:PPE family, PPE8 domain protein [Mycobacterium kansasii 732]
MNNVVDAASAMAVGETNVATAATVVGDGNSGVAAMADGRINVATAATVVGDGNSGVVAGADGSVNVGDGGHRGF